MHNDLNDKIVKWCNQRNDIEALIQIGSRAQLENRADQWSDWDYHLICKSVKGYLSYDWSSVFELPCWSVYSRKTSRNAIKTSIIFENGYEVDLVLLTAWQIKLIYYLMQYPQILPYLPKVLKNGIHDLRLIVKPGYIILKGDDSWKNRLTSVNYDIPALRSLQEIFTETVYEFWHKAIWVFKQIARGNYRAAQRAFHLHLREASYTLLMLEAEKKQRKPVHEARFAEQWLDADRIAQTQNATSAEKAMLLSSLNNEINLFDDLSKKVADDYSLSMPQFTKLKTWLLNQCNQL